MLGDSSKVALVAFLALVWCACTRETRLVSPPAYPAAAGGTVSSAVNVGDGDLAMRELRRRLAADAMDLDARMQLAKRYYAQGLPDLALEHYRLAAARFPDSPEVALALVETLREMEAPQEALRAAGEYLARHPHGSWELLSLQGVIEDEQGQFVEAEAAYRDALTVAPGRSAVHNNLGYNLLLQGRPDAAADEFRRAIELDPKSEIAHNNLGVALASRQNFVAKEALSEWQRSSGPAAAHNNLAAVLMGQGRDAEARAELRAALGFQGDFQPALANLKLLSEKDGQPVTVPAAPARRSIWTKLFGAKKPQPARAETGSTALANSVGIPSGPVDTDRKQ